MGDMLACGGHSGDSHNYGALFLRYRDVLRIVGKRSIRDNTR